MEKVLDHIGVAVRDIKEAIPGLAVLFGDPDTIEFESLDDQNLKVAFLDLGGLQVELLQPTNENGPVAKFLDKRGPGIHHIAWKVADISESFDDCVKAGLRVLSERPYRGARNKMVFFIHPKDTSGILTELCSSIN